MDFISIDFETANTSGNSICSLGFVLVKNNEIISKNNYLINPETSFSQVCTNIHGISRKDVQGAPNFPEVWSIISSYFYHFPVVAHNASFEKSVLEKTANRYDIKLPIITYYCTQRIAEYNFNDFEHYTLEYVCDKFEVKLEKHHCSADDSIATANLMIKYLSCESINVFASYISDITYERNVQKKPSTARENFWAHKENGAEYKAANVKYSDCKIEFSNKIFLLTGEAEGYTRTEVQNKIRNCGGIVVNNVSRKLNYLVAGNLDINVIKDSKQIKSQKIIKVEELNKNGADIKIISFDDLLKGCESE